MDLKYVTSEGAPRPAGPYSQAVIAGDFVFVSGQFGKDPNTDSAPEGIESQTRQALSNIESILRAAGAGVESIVKVGIHLRRISDWGAVNGVYEAFFGSNFPARTVVEAVLRADYLIEIDCVAFKPRP